MMSITNTNTGTIMMPMTIRIMNVSAQHGVVYASIRADVPELGAIARIAVRFAAPSGTDERDWREEAYDRALMMLDPA